MKVVGSIVDREAVLLAVHGELATTNAVAISAHKGRKEWFGTAQTILDAVMALYDICHFAISVWYHDGYKRTTIIGYAYFHALSIGQSVQVSLFALYHGLKVFALQAGNQILLHWY